jgi:phosphoribosylformylglycinamidine synthase
MIHFFEAPQQLYYLVQTKTILSPETIQKLNWLFGGAQKIHEISFQAKENHVLIGPRAAMVTPWSTNAVEITQNMGIKDISFMPIKLIDVVAPV